MKIPLQKTVFIAFLMLIGLGLNQTASAAIYFLTASGAANAKLPGFHILQNPAAKFGKTILYTPDITLPSFKKMDRFIKEERMNEKVKPACTKQILTYQKELA